MVLKTCLALAVAAVACASPAVAASRGDVLVLVNTRHPYSADVAERYRMRYDVPEQRVLALDVELGDQISRADYVNKIQQPVAAWFHREAAHDQITYIVLGPGFPVRVAGTVGRTGTIASVDSELALLYRLMTGAVPGPAGPARNPYFTEAPSDGQWPAFDRARLDTYLVGRLDGYTREDVLALVDRCQGASAGGVFVLDDRAPLDVREHRWFATAAERLTERLEPGQVVFDRTLSTVQDERDVMAFYSWGAADPGHRQRPLPLTFRPGAVVASLSSTDARTFTAPPDDWRPGSWQSRQQYYEGSPEWLAADFIRAGVTGVVANVSDPYGDGAVRPDVLLPAYASGRTLGEAAWMAAPSVSWQTVLVGDPLCQPFGSAPPPSPTFEVDETTHLTTPFLERVTAHALAEEPGAPRTAVTAIVAARVLGEQGREDEARVVLADLATRHPDYLPGLVMRAQVIEATGDRAAAMQAYREVLEKAPGSIVALNNLAYLLVDEEGGAPEALSLARQAYQQSRGAPVVADTYGWVLLRSGESAQAMRILRDAVRALPTLAELRLHLARALLAEGQVAEARQEWERALELDPAMRTHAHAGPLRDTFSAAHSGG